MKYTGVTWMPEVGDGFILYKLKHLLAKPLLYGASESGIPYDNNLPRYIRITDISLDGRLKDNEKLSLSYESANDYILNDKDILLARSGATVGKAFLYKKEYGSCAFAGYLIKASLNPKLIIPEFLFYYTQCSIYEEWKNQIFVQATIQNIGADKYSELHIPVPSLIKQQDIITFLDRKCADIDNVLGKTKASIEEYKKLKQSVITEAVTSGIRGERPMKASGIDWIGDIPSDWAVEPLGGTIRRRTEVNHPDAIILSLYRDYGVVPKDSRDDNHNVTSLDTTNYKFVRKGDFVVNKMKAWQGSMAVSEYEGIVSPAYHVCEIVGVKFNKKYLHHLLRNQTYLPEYLRLSTGMRIGQWDLSYYDFRHIPVVIPPLEEQSEIVSYIDQRCSEIDSLIASKEKIITELESYKKSLINECITGKKEVPTTV